MHKGASVKPAGQLELLVLFVNEGWSLEQSMLRYMGILSRFTKSRHIRPSDDIIIACDKVLYRYTACGVNDVSFGS